MAERSIDIDKVVREVLAKIGPAPQGSGAPPAQSAAGKMAEVASPGVAGDGKLPAAATPGAEELVVSTRVVTMAELGDRLEGVRRVVVPVQAVLTPSVRDELRRKNIALVYEQPRPAPAAGSARLVLMTVGKSFDPAGLVTALGNEGIEVDPRRSDCFFASSDELAGEVAGGRAVGVMLTSQPAVALCVANRLPGVRAVLGTDAAETAAAAASVGANLLVVAPRARTFFQLKHLVREFCRGGVRECPELLRERLA